MTCFSCFVKLFNSSKLKLLFVLQDYLTVVKKPMDFGTIKKNIEDHVYTDAEEALADCQQVFDNCFLYNKPQDVCAKFYFIILRY